MSLLADLALEQTPDLGPVAEGQYSVTIKAARLMSSKQGKPMLRIVYSVDGEPTADSIFFYRTLPSAGDTDEDKLRTRANIRAFCKAHSIPLDVFESAIAAVKDQFELSPETGADVDLKGFTAQAIVAVEEGDDGTIRNVIKRFV